MGLVAQLAPHCYRERRRWRCARLSRSGMADGPITLFQSDYVVVSLEFGGRIVRYRRLAQPFPSLSCAAEVYASVIKAYDQIGRTGRGLLIDSRDAPGRNDPEFEALLADFRSKALPGFTGNAVLVRTAVGLLQAQRHSRSEGRIRLITDDVHEAIGELLKVSPGPGKSSPVGPASRISGTTRR